MIIIITIIIIMIIVMIIVMCGKQAKYRWLGRRESYGGGRGRTSPTSPAHNPAARSPPTPPTGWSKSLAESYRRSCRKTGHAVAKIKTKILMRKKVHSDGNMGLKVRRRRGWGVLLTRRSTLLKPLPLGC